MKDKIAYKMKKYDFTLHLGLSCSWSEYWILGFHKIY